jgi:hypothetical protein
MTTLRAVSFAWFCAGLALAWCGTAEAQTTTIPFTYGGTSTSRPEDVAKVEIDDLKDRVKWLEQVLVVTAVNAGDGVALTNNGSVPLRVELAPDQKLARAYALCEQHIVLPCSNGSCNSVCMFRPGSSTCGGSYLFESCNKIAQEWLASSARKAADQTKQEEEDFLTATDRAFIEEVARTLK